MHKTLLGDAFFETRLIQQQILASTGQRFLSGYSTDADQMRGLMGAAYAQAEGLHLTVGVALSKDQVAALTQDVIWLVEQEYEGQKVLVPQLYLAAGGNIVSETTLNRSVTDRANISGSRLDDVASISAGSLSMQAGNNITVGTVVTGFNLDYGKYKDATTNTGSLLSVGGNLTLVAGNDPLSKSAVAVIASQLGAAGTLTLQATGDVIVASAQNTAQSSFSKSSSGMLSSSSRKGGAASVTQVGSNLVGENVNIRAGSDIAFTASNVVAAKDASMSAGGTILLNAAQNEQSSYYKSSSSQSGVFTSGSTLAFSSSEKKSSGSGASGNIGSAIVAGNDIKLAAGQDITSVGSLISAGNDASLNAGRDVNLLSGRDTSYAYASKSKSVTGISGNIGSSGVSVGAGYQSTAKGSTQDAAVNAGSLLQAGNDITITAGRDVNQIASHMEAGRDIALNAGRDWNMLAGQDVQNTSAWRKDVQAGVTIALEENVSKAVQTVASLPQAMGQGQGGLGYQGITAASAGLQTVTSVYKAIFQTVSASITLGGSVAEQKSSSSSSMASPSTVFAGRDFTVFTGQDINIEGGRVQAVRDVTLDAGRDLNIFAAQNTYKQQQASSSTSAGVSVSVGFGASGLSASGSVSASAAGSQANASGISHTNALVAAGGTLTTSSGRDTNVRGAHLQGTDVDMTVGRDLNVESLQDTSKNSGNSWSVGGSIGFDVTGMLPGSIAGMDVKDGNGWGLSLGGGTSSGNSAWVKGQTSITAKDSLNIYTEKNTNIRGAVIAADSGDLTLNTGTLTYSDIYDKNKQENLSANIGSGGSLKNLSLSGNYGKTDQEQINRATVGTGTIIIRSDPSKGLEGLNRDLAKAQEMTKNDKVNVTVYVDIPSIIDLYNEVMKLLPDDSPVRKNVEAQKDYYDKLIESGKSPEEAQRIVQEYQYQTNFAKSVESFVAENGGDINKISDDVVLKFIDELRTDPSIGIVIASSDPALSGMIDAARSTVVSLLGVAQGAQDGVKSTLIYAYDSVAYSLYIASGGTYYQEQASRFVATNNAIFDIVQSPSKLLDMYGDKVKAIEALDAAGRTYEADLARGELVATVLPILGATASGMSNFVKVQKNVSVAAKPALPSASTGMGGAFTENPQNMVNARRLAADLRRQSAESIFTPSGGLKPEVIAGAQEIIEARNIKNPSIPPGFSKYTTETFSSPAGDFQVHFYKNPTTGEAFYGQDYKAKFNK